VLALPDHLLGESVANLPQRASERPRWGEPLARVSAFVECPSMFARANAGPPALLNAISLCRAQEINSNDVAR
jgi:hypothetical protein